LSKWKTTPANEDNIVVSDQEKKLLKENSSWISFIIIKKDVQNQSEYGIIPKSKVWDV